MLQLPERSGTLAVGTEGRRQKRFQPNLNTQKWRRSVRSARRRSTSVSEAAGLGSAPTGARTRASLSETLEFLMNED